MTADELRAHYAGITLPEGPIPYKAGETITDPARFLANQLHALDMPPHTRFHQNACMRLRELMEYLNQNPNAEIQTKTH